MTAFLNQIGAANDAPRKEIGSGINDYCTVQIAEPYLPNAPQMTGWGNMVDVINPLWPRSSLLGNGGQDGIQPGVGGILHADCQRWEWSWPPTGQRRRKAISGTVVNSSGAVVAGATVRLFNTATGALVDTQTSGPDGSFTCGDPNGVSCFLVAYLAGSPDTEGTTLNTLTGT